MTGGGSQAGQPGQALALAPQGGSQPALPPRPPVQSAWLATALRDLSRPSLPGGARVAVRRLPGRPLAAAEICLVPPSLQSRGEEGRLALGLALATKGRKGEEAGAFTRRISEAGARLELRPLSPDAIALELVAPPSELPGLTAAILGAMADPAFAAADFPVAVFDSVMRDFRVRSLRDQGDPLAMATRALADAAWDGHPKAGSAFGTPTSLLAIDRGSLATAWSRDLSRSVLAISAVGDLDAESFGATIAPALARIESLRVPAQPAGSAPVPAADEPRRTVPGGPYLATAPDAGAAWLVAAFPAPAMGDPDYASLLVALAMLDDILMEEFRGNAGATGGAATAASRPGGPMVASAYSAWSRLNPDASPSGSIIVARTGSAAAARAAVERALDVVVSGHCLSLSGTGHAPQAEALEAYKARALARLYGGSASAADLARRVARDLCAGGDGSAWFRLADRLAAVNAEDLARVARERLRADRMTWAAAGPEALIKGL